MSSLGWILFPTTLILIGLLFWLTIRHAAKRHHVTLWEQMFGEKSER